MAANRDVRGGPAGTRERASSRDRWTDATLESAGRAGLATALRALRDDLGFDTASVFVGGANGWELLHREGPLRAWHAILDPSLFEGSPEAAEYEDARTIPGAGTRLAGMGVASVAVLPLPDGGRLLLDSSSPSRSGSWVERARPYLSLIQLLAGPAWSAGGSLRNQEEVAALHRLFEACQRTLAVASATPAVLLDAAREALGADELFVLIDRGGDLEVVSPLPDASARRLDADVRRAVVSSPGRDLDSHALQRVSFALGLTSRALAAAFGRDDDPEVVVAGWLDGPALSPASMSIAARGIATARAALGARQSAVNSVIERERARMAYAIHDGLTQSVAGAVLELEALRKRVEESPAEALATLESSKTEIRRALGELRAILFDLSRPPGHEPEPSEPLTRYVQDVVKRWRLPARVAVEGDVARVPGRILSVAYVVIREALANAAKHASAGSVTVTIAANDAELRVVVGDAGRGFTREEQKVARAANHYGLEMIRRRVREIGGRLQVQSTPGAGTRVVARFPLQEAS